MSGSQPMTAGNTNTLDMQRNMLLGGQPMNQQNFQSYIEQKQPQKQPKDLYKKLYFKMFPPKFVSPQ